MASRGEGPRSPESADSHARVMTQKRLLLSDSLVWAVVILACAGVLKGNSDPSVCCWCSCPAGRLRRAVGRTRQPTQQTTVG